MTSLMIRSASIVASRAAVPILFLLTLSVGCSASKETVSGDGGVLSGVYDIVTVNGSALPVVWQNGEGYVVTGLSAVVTPIAGGRFTVRYNYRVKYGMFSEEFADMVAGSYTLNGSTVVFAADSAISKKASPYLVNGTVSGATITLQGTPAPGQPVTLTLRRR